MALNGRDLFNPDGEAIGTILVNVTDGTYYSGPSKYTFILSQRYFGVLCQRPLHIVIPSLYFPASNKPTLPR